MKRYRAYSDKLRNRLGIFYDRIALVTTSLFTSKENEDKEEKSEDVISESNNIKEKEGLNEKEEASNEQVEFNIEKDLVYNLLKDLETETKLSFTEIKNDEVIWNSKNIKLKLTDGKSFKSNKVTLEEKELLKGYFLNKKVDSGTIGFEFVSPANVNSSGFIFREGPAKNIMCVLTEEQREFSIGCGPSR